ncbi:MAG TPA: 5-oxoprolinase subunit PxpA [Chitinophagaceae bacterium]|nr:5-oxoprolinase subunit PxpA [Chitinophagaceae bacterium]
MLRIDINCDMGEGAGKDDAVMPFVSSANIACGYHAGDEHSMRQTIELAIKNNVAIGAHPSFFDRKNFGRTELHLRTDEIYDLVLLQLRTIDKIMSEKRRKLHHVKPHGALYNMSAKNSNIAQAIAQAVKDFDDNLILFGLSGSASIAVANRSGLKTASEVFADRTYQDDGSLTPRSQAGALVEDESKLLEHVFQMVQQKSVTTVSGKTIPIVADTVCIHGDGKHAVQFAEGLNKALRAKGIEIRSLS